MFQLSVGIVVFVLAMIGIAICLLLAIVYNVCFAFKRLRYPSGPLPLPFAGNLPLLRFGNDVNAMCELLDKYGQKYNGVFTLWMPDPIVVLTDPHVLLQVLTDQDRVFRGRPPRYTASLLHDGELGLMQLSGRAWRTQHQFLAKFLSTRNSTIEQYISAEVQALRTRMEAMIEKQADGEYGLADLEQPITVHMANMMSSLLWGKSYRAGSEELRVLLDAVLTRVDLDNKARSHMLDAYAWLRYLPILNRFDYSVARLLGKQFRDILMPKILNRKNELFLHGVADDVDERTCDLMTAYLMHAKKQKELPKPAASTETDTPVLDENGNIEKKQSDASAAGLKHPKQAEQRQPVEDDFSDEQLCALMIDLFCEGTYKMSTQLLWVLLYSCLYPQVQKQSRQDILSGTGEGDASMAQAMLYEVQRLNNVQPINALRVAKDNIKLGKHKIRKGTFILPQLAAVGHNPKYFSHPEDFYPRRFFRSISSAEEENVAAAKSRAATSATTTSRSTYDGPRQVALDMDGPLDQALLRRLYTYGLGSRQCAGDWLSSRALQQAIAMLIGRFDFRLDQPAPSSSESGKQRRQRQQDLMKARSSWCNRSRPFKVRFALADPNERPEQIPTTTDTPPFAYY